jgi:hypothetical protein
MARLFDHGLELLAGVEGHDAPRADRDLLAGLGVAAGALRLVAQLEVAEAREASTMSLASRLFSPTFSNKRSASSALVKVIPNT